MCRSGDVKSHHAKVSENDQELTKGHLRTMALNLALGDSRMCHILFCPGGRFPHHAPCRTDEIRLPLTVMASASTTCFYSGEAAGPPSSVWALRARRDCLTSGGRVIPAICSTVRATTRILCLAGRQMNHVEILFPRACSTERPIFATDPIFRFASFRQSPLRSHASRCP